MPRKLFDLEIDYGRMGTIHSLFVEEKATVDFVEDYQGLCFYEDLGMHSELIQAPGSFCFGRHFDADPKVVAFIEENPIGPVPDAIRQAIQCAIEDAEGDPVRWAGNDSFLEMLDVGGGSDVGYADRNAFYKDCLEDAFESPDKWTGEEDFWDEIQTRDPDKFKAYVRLCRNKDLNFMLGSDVDDDSDSGSEPSTEEMDDSSGNIHVKKKIGDIGSGRDPTAKTGSCKKRVCT